MQPLGGKINSTVNGRGELGFIPQRLGLIGNVSVLANVMNGVRVKSSWSRGFFSSFNSNSIEDANSAIVKLDFLIRRIVVRTLSGGQQRRVATARTLAQIKIGISR